jgi:hypothetical protein
MVGKPFDLMENRYIKICNGHYATQNGGAGGTGDRISKLTRFLFGYQIKIDSLKLILIDLF